MLMRGGYDGSHGVRALMRRIAKHIRNAWYVLTRLAGGGHALVAAQRVDALGQEHGDQLWLIGEVGTEVVD